MIKKHKLSMLFAIIAILAGSVISPVWGQSTFENQFPRFVQAQRVVVLSLAVDGIVEEVFHEPQDYVKEGDVLMKLDSEQTEMEIENYQLQIRLNREVEYKTAEIRVNYSNDNLEIVKKNYEKMISGARVASVKELKEAIQSKEIAELELKKTDIEWELYKVKLKQANKILSQHKLTAPMNGVLVPFSRVKHLEESALKRIEKGEAVRATTPAMAMMKVDKLRVPQTVDKQMYDKVFVGQEAVVYIQGADEKAIPATVVFKSPTIVPEIGKFDIEVEFDNPVIPEAQRKGGYPYKYRPGMRARAELK